MLVVSCKVAIKMQQLALRLKYKLQLIAPSENLIFRYEKFVCQDYKANQNCLYI